MTKNQLTAVVLLFFTVVYLLPLGVRPLLIPDEPRHAEIPREMIISGDWVLPHFKRVYSERPAGI